MINRLVDEDNGKSTLRHSQPICKARVKRKNLNQTDNNNSQDTLLPEF